MLLLKGIRYFALLLSCLVLSSCAGRNDYDMASEEAASDILEESIGISEKEFTEIKEFMNDFMTFPVIRDFDQQDMSGAVDYFAQKWVWTDLTELEYDAKSKAFYVSSSDFIEKMGQYFVMSDSALKSIEEKAMQGKLRICADAYQAWGFSFEIDRAEEKEGAYYVHGYNAEVAKNTFRIGDELIIGSKADPFLEFSAVIVRDEKDGCLRLRELDGLKNGPGREVNVSEVSDDVKKELTEFAAVFSEGTILEGFDLNDLTGVFDFSAQKILQTNMEAIRELDDGRCVVSLYELKDFMDQYFYLPKGYEKCLPKEGKNTYPCLAGDDVIFLKKENKEEYELRTDLPVIQNNHYYSYGVYNVKAEELRNELTVEGMNPADKEAVIKERFPFELMVIKAVRGEDGKLRLLYFKSYYL